MTEMIKKILGFVVFGILLAVLFFNTHMTLIGSGFLIGDGNYVFTYHDLVKEAETIKVRFPNEDDIAAKVIFIDPSINLAILKLEVIPKVKPQPLKISRQELGPISKSVFTLGYPWTNTLADQHILIEGSAYEDASILIDLNMALDPVHSGSPLFNTRQEVIGMVLFVTHAKTGFSHESSNNFAIPAQLLRKALKAAKIDATHSPMENLTKEVFISKSRNNIVLIEAR